MKKMMLLVILSITSCASTNCEWKGGEIINFGEYCNRQLKISVYEKDDYLKYIVRNSSDEIVIQEDMNISIFQGWGLFLDKSENFWILSSDVGICVWKKDTVTGKYSKKTFYQKLRKDEVPQELYESSLRRFL